MFRTYPPAAARRPRRIALALVAGVLAVVPAVAQDQQQPAGQQPPATQQPGTQPPGTQQPAQQAQPATPARVFASDAGMVLNFLSSWFLVFKAPARQP